VKDKGMELGIVGESSTNVNRTGTFNE